MATGHIGGQDIHIRLLTGVVLSWALLGQLQLAGGQETVTNFHQFYLLNKDEAASGRPVQFKSIVLCSDPGWGQLYMHDGVETKYFKPPLFQNPFEVGQIVQIIGRTTYAAGAPGLTNLEAAVLGRQDLPPAKTLRLRDFGSDLGQWVETSGEVRVADTSWGRLALVVKSEELSCVAYVMGPPPLKDFKRFVGSKVTVRGINASKIANKRLVKPWLFVPNLDEVKVLEPTNINPSALPVSAIEAVMGRELRPGTQPMVRISGTVIRYKPGEFIEVSDPTGTLRAEVVQMTRVQQDQRVDLWAYAALGNAGLVLSDGYFELAGSSKRALAESPPGSQPASPSQPPLTQISQVVHLSKTQADSRLPVRLSGVVTFADPEWHNVFLHDDSGEVYVESAQPDVRSGQYVEVTGATSRGGFAPEVIASAIRVLGTTNLPAAPKVNLGDLASGQLDCHWIELEGVVRRTSEEWGHLSLSVMTPLGQFRAIVPMFNDQSRPAGLIDSLVSVRGACAAQMNARGQMSGITLHVPSLAQVHTLEPAPADPFSVGATPIANVAVFDPDRVAGRRVKVVGGVSLVVPGQGFYLQDRTGGIRVDSPRAAELRVGDAVEALGFVALGDFSPHLDEAIFRPTGAAQLPPARQTTAEQILVQGLNDGMRVELEAQLVQSITRSARPRLALQQGPVLFSASLFNPRLDQELSAWKAGSVLRLTGVVSIQGNEAREPEAFKLLIDAPRDIVLVSAPPWWTLRHTLMAGAGMVGSIAAALAWIILLRRQVRAQTDLLQRNQRELLEISRQAGMAEVATSVLHNVGNVLTSVTVTSTLMKDQIRQSKVASLCKAADLLREHEADLDSYLTRHPKGKRLPEFLRRLAQHLAAEQQTLLEESSLLQKHIEHIREIVAMQQTIAKSAGLTERVLVTDVVEDALRINELALQRHGVQITRHYDASAPQIIAEKHKVLQILVNLIQNAKYACSESGRSDKEVKVEVAKDDAGICISVEDNGIGIRPENLNRIFNHGFTTRKGGHGFGLHSGALAATQMGGSLCAQSHGPGCGARFTLALPLTPRKHT